MKLALALLLALGACSTKSPAQKPDLAKPEVLPAAAPSPMLLRSPAFEDKGPIPRAFTCQGEDQSPALEWGGLPAGTKSLALVLADPDAPDPQAPKMTWIHWVLYDLSPKLKGLAPGVSAHPPEGSRPGLNGWKRVGYGGPCPPIGRHRYYFKLYALDTMLGELRSPDATKLEAAMAGHILGRVELVGTYQKEN